MTDKIRRIRPAFLVAVAAVLLCTLLVRSSAMAMGPEKKIIIYIVYHKGSAAQKTFVEHIFKNFIKLGFAERMKKKGVSWVEAGYGAAGSATSFLDIGADDIIYFGVLMADGQERITREMFRSRVTVGSTKEKKIKQQAENDAHRLYFGASDVLDLFQNKARWNHQVALVNYKSLPTEPVKVVVDGKDVMGSVGKAFRHQNIHVAMVPANAPLWKRLGAESGSDGKSVAWIKKGTRRVLFEIGDAIVSTRIWAVSYHGGTYKHFVAPVTPMFAYPEMQGDTMYIPLGLAVKQLGLPYDVTTEGDTVTLTHKGPGGKKATPKPPTDGKDDGKKPDEGKPDDKKGDAGKK